MKCDVFFLFTDKRREAQPAGIVLLTGRFLGFRPAGATRCTDQSEIWQGGADRLLSAKFHLDRLRGVQRRNQKTYFGEAYKPMVSAGV